ncbi:hypothetical protein J4U01_gp102 [Mycobacterium phage Kumao]|uniref:Uncharacterized protein n=1 Tax=Mycobacterium phage Kumao TaxID=2041344 RepID=A0A2D1GPT1_9CAUD|nr:hypothetical protein J4U01_gp102 [Mycobacterium phage Kumao]ATN94056.1 hypothetical protein SEA_KUMAO_94 [Mycobacterium phage Kumao]
MDRYKVVRQTVKKEVFYVRASSFDEAEAIARERREMGVRGQRSKTVEWEAYYSPGE